MVKPEFLPSLVTPDGSLEPGIPSIYQLLCPFPGLLLVVSFNKQQPTRTWKVLDGSNLDCNTCYHHVESPLTSISSQLQVQVDICLLRETLAPQFSHSPEIKNLGHSKRLGFQKHKSWFFPRAFH